MTINTPTGNSSPQSQKLSLREEGKLDKQRRIQAAARKEFAQKGFNGATTRDIARKARVSIGTLFVYAKDKRELLMMALNDDLDEMGRHATQRVDPGKGLLEQLLQFFEPRYQYWAANPKMARPVVTEIFDVVGRPESMGPETERFYARRQQTMRSLTAILEGAMRSGKANSQLDARLAASLIMTLYISAVRRWLNQENPQAPEGIAELTRLIQLAIQGLGP